MEDCDGFVDVPIFYGDDPEEWISWVESFCSDYSDFEKLQFAYGFVEGDALDWYFDETSHSPINSWELLKAGLLQRFSKAEEITGAVFKQRDECDGTMSSIWSCSDMIEKFFLETNEKLEEKNHRAEEKDKSSFRGEEIKSGFHETKKEETHQYEEEKQTKANKGEPACQVFEKMTKRRKKKKKKKKKKKRLKNGQVVMTALMTPERTVNWHGSLVARLLLEDLNLPLSDSVSDGSSSLLATVSHAIKTEDISLAQVVLSAFLVSVDRSDKAQKMVMEKGLHLVRDSAKNFSKNYNLYGKSKGCMKNERVIRKNIKSWWNYQVLEVSAGKVNKKPGVKMKMHTHHVYVKMLLRRKIVKEKRRFDSKSDSFKFKDRSLHKEKLLRKQMKNKPRRHKNWTVRASQRLTCCCHKRNINTYQRADKLWSLISPKKKKKSKMKEIRSVVLFLAEHNNQIQQVIIGMLIAGVEMSKEKMFGTSGKRHKFRHKHKKRVVLVLSFYKKRVFVDQVFKMKKITRLKLEREFAKPNCVQAVVYVKLLWRFIIVKKNQLLKRLKFRQKHRKRKTYVVKNEGHGKVFFKMWLPSFCAKKKTENTLNDNSHLPNRELLLQFTQRKKKRKRRRKSVESKQHAWKRVLVVVVAMFLYGTHVKLGKLTGNSIISLCPMNDLGNRFVSDNTKIKNMAYVEKEFVKEWIPVAFYQREWALSFGKRVTIAAETVSTVNNDGKTVEKVSLATVNREREARLSWVGFLVVYVTTFAGISGKNNGLAWDNCAVDILPWGTITRMLMEVQGERQGREGIAKITYSTKLKLKSRLKEHTRSYYTEELNADTKSFYDPHLEDKVNFEQRGIDRSSDLEG